MFRGTDVQSFTIGPPILDQVITSAIISNSGILQTRMSLDGIDSFYRTLPPGGEGDVKTPLNWAELYEYYRIAKISVNYTWVGVSGEVPTGYVQPKVSTAYDTNGLTAKENTAAELQTRPTNKWQVMPDRLTNSYNIPCYVKSPIMSMNQTTTGAVTNFKPQKRPWLDCTFTDTQHGEMVQWCTGTPLVQYNFQRDFIFWIDFKNVR